MESDASHAPQLLRLCEEHVSERPELPEQPASGHRGYPGRCGERALWGRVERGTLGALRVGRTIDVPHVAASAKCDSRDPRSCIDSVARVDHRDSELPDADQQAADGFWTQRIFIQRRAFEEQVRPGHRSPEPSDLRPQPAFDEREMKPANGLAFDQRKVVDRVVTCRQVLEINGLPKVAKRVGNSALALVNVDDDLHARTMPSRVSRRCARLAPNLATSDFAGS